MAYRRFDIIFFDVGHTLCWPDLHGMTNMAMRVLGRPVTQAQLARGDREARRRINNIVKERGPQAALDDRAEIPLIVMEYYEAMVSHAGTGFDTMPAGTLADLYAQWWCRQLQENWYSVLGPDVIPCLDRLAADGWRLGVISNSEGRVHELLTKVGIRDYFEVMIDSGVEGVAKPDPAIFRLAAQRANVPLNRCLFIGDQPDVDIKGALAAGMCAIHYDPQGAFADAVLDGVPTCRNLLAVADGSIFVKMMTDAARSF